jgi:hypothetical protein
VVAGLALVDLAGAALPADVGVVVGDLSEAAGDGEVVDAAVADVGEVEPSRGEPAEAEGGTHAGAFLVAVAEVEEVLVDLGDELGEDVGKAGVEALGGGVELASHQAGDAIDRDATGEFAGVGAAHAIADCEDEIGLGEGGFADLAEVVDAELVDGEGEEGVLVVLADPAAVGDAGPVDGEELVGVIREGGAHDGGGVRGRGDQLPGARGASGGGEARESSGRGGVGRTRSRSRRTGRRGGRR